MKKTRHTLVLVGANSLRTVGQCGGSEVTKNINTVQFLAQTDRFVSLDLNVSSQAAGFHLVLSVYVFFFSLSKPLKNKIIVTLILNGMSAAHFFFL